MRAQRCQASASFAVTAARLNPENTLSAPTISMPAAKAPLATERCLRTTAATARHAQHAGARYNNMAGFIQCSPDTGGGIFGSCAARRAVLLTQSRRYHHIQDALSIHLVQPSASCGSRPLTALSARFDPG